MAIDSLINRHPKRKFKMVSFRTVCRAIWNHPFIVATLLFVICLHRYFPSVFYLLLSASPVFVCTAVLLGALLIHGQPNNPKVEYRGETSDPITSLRTRTSEDTSFSSKDRIFPNDRFAEVRKDIVEKGRVVGTGIRSVYGTPKEVDWEYCKIHKERDFQIPKVGGLNLAEKSDRKMSEIQNDVDDRADHDHESIDSESDMAEKSSLDALVAHVILTPQETLPLLDSEEPQLPGRSHDVSPKSELQSVDSNHSSRDSDEETDYRDEEGEDENNYNDDEDEDEPRKEDKKIHLDLGPSEMEKSEYLESLISRNSDKSDEEEEDEEEEEEEEVVGASDDDDDDDDEETLDVEKDESKQVIMWTEEDEKNLRYVGNSELERNQRLENLLARRRAQRNFSMISERNLIDLDRPDLPPFQVTPISTTRVNPFETPDDTNPNNNPSVPPIPGSAPSITVPRKNPFDSPCTSPKGTHNLTTESPKEESMEVNNLNNPLFHANPTTLPYNPMGDVPRPEFVEINRKDAVFRRYESFSPGYNFMADASRHEFMETDRMKRRDATISRHESFRTRSPFPNIFTPESFHLKPVFVPEQLAEEGVDHPSLERQSSQDSEYTVSSGSDTESLAASVTHEDVEHDQETELQREVEAINAPDHVSNPSENKSESSKAFDSLKSDQDEPQEDGISQKTEATTYDNHGTAPSSSVSSEEGDRSANTSKDEGEKVGESGFSPRKVSDDNHVTVEDDHIHVEPVYDTSPSGAEKNGPFSSVAAEI